LPEPISFGLEDMNRSVIDANNNFDNNTWVKINNRKSSIIPQDICPLLTVPSSEWEISYGEILFFKKPSSKL
jgi:hypothetical protein